MSKGKKFIFILADLFFLTILIPILWDYFNQMNFRWELSPSSETARRKHSVTAAIFDCCTLICRIGEKLAVYPSQMPRVLE